MRPAGAKLARVVAIAALLSGVAVSPALADHDHDRQWHGQGKHYGHRRHGPPVRYYGGYERRYYYYAPHADYYAPPPVYVVPPPPSWGLNLVFPLHIH